MLSLMLLLFGISVCFSADENNLGLMEVHLLYRHGARTQCGMYPTDPFKDSSNWPMGFCQLTSEGKIMDYDLGKWLRQRYDGFLSNNYSEEEIFVRSTYMLTEH
jgi:hypothetical protein